jgi:hypothetical protein
MKKRKAHLLPGGLEARPSRLLPSFSLLGRAEPSLLPPLLLTPRGLAQGELQPRAFSSLVSLTGGTLLSTRLLPHAVTEPEKNISSIESNRIIRDIYP